MRAEGEPSLECRLDGAITKQKEENTEVTAAWRNGDWEYAAFTADKKPNAKANANTKACFDCHLPHAGQDFVISLAGLKGTALGAANVLGGVVPLVFVSALLLTIGIGLLLAIRNEN